MHNYIRYKKVKMALEPKDIHKGNGYFSTSPARLYGRKDPNLGIMMTDNPEVTRNIGILGVLTTFGRPFQTIYLIKKRRFLAKRDTNK